MHAAMLSPDQFTQLTRLINERIGIRLPPHKRGMLSNRLRRRMDALGIATFDDYCRLLASDAGRSDEWPHFLSTVTTTETYFFRSAAFWELLAKEVVPNLIAAPAAGRPRTLRVWSAAASNGAEAYTAAIVLLENIPRVDEWRIDVLGTDICEEAVHHAESGLYDDYALSMTDEARAKRWFEQADGLWRVCDEVRRLARFRVHNLRDPLNDEPFDVVLLRNVLIYFDDVMKRRVLRLVADTLRPGGYLVVGDCDPVRAMGRRVTDRMLDYAWPGVYVRTSFDPNALANASVAAADSTDNS